ncbi:MAG TPA: hypothetical protein PKC24_05880 [Cyclobacteriaceae bacterium]|nr:hypothetical protein [Cyclobacteriaceae bacterium]
MSIFSNPNRIPEKYGIFLAIGLTIYFILMKLVGLVHITELRILNVFILIWALWGCLKGIQQSAEGTNYFKNLISGVLTATVGVGLFALFLFFYMSFIDTGLMDSIRENEAMGRFLNPYMISFIILLEGVFSGLLFTFILNNYLEHQEE